MSTSDVIDHATELDTLAAWLDFERAAGESSAYLVQAAAVSARIAAAQIRAAERSAAAPAIRQRPGYVSHVREPWRPLQRHWTSGQVLLGVLTGVLLLIVILAVGSLPGGAGRTFTSELIPATAGCHAQTAGHR
jgi:hypothetical protein